jgi:multidrug resistance protein, MATE family
VPLLGAVDTAVVGHLPEVHYVGAVAVGAMLFNYLYYLFNCLRMGTTGPTAQARGAGDYAEVRAMIGRALLLAGAIGGVVIALQLPIVAAALWMIDASPEVERYARQYFLIRVWAMPAVLGSYAIFGWLYGVRDARQPLAIQMVMNALNIGLDFLFVFGFDWGVRGVAVASLVASYFGLVLGIYAVLRTLRRLPGDGRRARLLDRQRLVRMVSVNSDIVLRTLCAVTATGYFTAKGAAVGDVALAANQVLLQFIVFTSFALDGFAHAGETVLGEAAGRHDRAGFARGVRVLFLWAGLVGVVNVLFYALLGHHIVDVMTALPEVRAGAADYLVWVMVLPIIQIWPYTYDGVYLAAVRTRAMRNTMVIALGAFVVLVNVLMPVYGNTGLWIAYSCYLGMRGLLLHALYPALLRAI